MCPVIQTTHQELCFSPAFPKLVSQALKDFGVQRGHLLAWGTLSPFHALCLESSLEIPAKDVNYATFLGYSVGFLNVYCFHVVTSKFNFSAFQLLCNVRMPIR